MTNVLLAAIGVLLALLLWQAQRQHRELLDTLNALAEMLGEAIDTWRGTR